jgi:uncharacterized membrane protein (UPF0182 family)
MTSVPISRAPQRRRTMLIVGVVAAIFLAVTALPALISLAADWYWFQSINYETVFMREVGTKALLFLAVGSGAFAWYYLNLRVAQRGVVPDPIIVRLSGSERLDLTRLLRRLSFPTAALLAVPTGLAAAGSWLTVLRFLNGTPFEITDPVFGRDIGFYVFTLPMLTWVLGLVFTLTILALILLVPLYFMRRDIVVWNRRFTLEPSAELHLAALVALLFIALAVKSFLVDIPSLTYSTTGPLVGASYTDLSVQVPVLRVAGVAAAVAALLVLAGARRRRLLRNGLIGLGTYVAILVGGALTKATIQKLVVAPNELAREAPQLEHHIAATRAAWGLANVTIRDLSGEATLTAADIAANRGTIRNVRLWDRDPLLQTFGQIQAIRTYYDFVSVDDDRYWIDGEYRQVLLAPRELNAAALPTRTFINEHLTFTHGMGLALSPVNLVTAEGLPVLFIKDLPPVSNVSLTVSRPGIYFGELSNEYVFVNTRLPEFDYPSGDENATTVYDGTGGVPVSSFLRRLVLSVRFGSLNVLLTGNITSESRAMYHRRVRERAAKALPFFSWDADPYLVITADGRLKWILDAYTTTTRYPYAQPMANGTNYMRNSAKVVIDAYDGDVRAYVADPADPLIRTWSAIFPGILLPLDSMGADLRSHIRYPNDLFRAQTALYTAFHMSEAAEFYHREDQWQIPAAGRGESGRDPFLRHIIMKPPGETREEYILMAPFTPRQKDNLAAWMVGRSDGERYGELIVYRFPRQSLVFGPGQVVNRINQDTEISRQITLWDQRGTQVIRGSLLVIPIEESLIYVQALYLRAEGGQIPELKRVIVSHQNRVVMEETLEQGLARLFGDERGRPLRAAQEPAPGAPAAAAPSGRSDEREDLIRRASDAWERAMAAQRAGDWARYGEQMREVGELLRRLRGQQRETGAPGP